MAGLKTYNHQTVEKKWQKIWSHRNTNHPVDMLSAKKPFYNLWMFPYPSAEGLHVGTIFSSTGSDLYGRFMRMNGKDVFQPIGYDSFGIHSENYALKTGETPQQTLSRTIKNYQRQLKEIGHGYDWTRTATTSDPNYYKWTQWLFVQLFKAGLAYRQKQAVNWCPSCKTVIADEQVIAGECERCHTKVKAKELEQWLFRITKYADRLLANLEKITWSERVITAQTNWIGKKEGISIRYAIKNSKEKLLCWTSRPDTNFGATFIVIAPEHPLAVKLTTIKNKKKLSNYINSIKNKSKEERIQEGKKKNGVFTGSYAINNLTGKAMPIWVSDFVLMDVGTGAVVGVPGHDLRDFEFATKYNLSIIRVVIGPDGNTSPITHPKQVQEQEGTIINSDFLNGLDVHTAKEKIIDYLHKKGWGTPVTTYHLRDWLISRQRYWGPPIPMIYCESCAKAAKSWFSTSSRTKRGELLHPDQSDWNHAGWYPEENLPVALPHITDYQPKGTGRGPLADHPEFFNINCPACGAPARRETDVSDTFLDSSWYFLAYPNLDQPQYQNGPCLNIKHSKSKSASLASRRATPFNHLVNQKWLPVNLYFGGAEHSVLHLMYSRFITQVLYDLKYISFEEPFPHFFAHGLMIKDGAKMSKSRGNVVNPDEYIKKYGADTLRIYLMFMGPMDGNPDFRTTGIEGMSRFLHRLWDLFTSFSEESPRAEILADSDEHRRPSKNFEQVDSSHIIIMHQTIKKVTKDIQKFHYNTAIASIMEYVNFLRDHPSAVNSQTLIILCQLLAPFIPHFTEEVWVEVLGQPYSVHLSSWPSFDPAYTQENQLTVAIQVNGRLRSQLEIASEDANNHSKVIKLAQNNSKITPWLKGKPIKRTVYIPGKIVNFVI